MTMDPKECSSLSFELYEEILCRVPTESLILFKLMCKRWLALFKDKRFIYKHLALLQEKFIRTNHMDMVKIINPVTGALSSLSLPEDFRGRPQIYTMVHCDGLLLYTLESSAIAVWNPCLNQVRWIKPKISYPLSCFYGIGYDGLSRDGYKMMRFMNGIFTKKEYGNTGSYSPNVDIYEFNSNSWKTFNVSLDWDVLYPCRGVSLKGNMYWIAIWHSNSDAFVQSFNFSTETFEPLCSIRFEYGEYDVVALSAFRGNNLSFLHQKKEIAAIEVWVTNKIKNGVIISWTKFFNVTRPDLPILRADESFASPVHFIDTNKRIVLCCEEVFADAGNVCVNT